MIGRRSERRKLAQLLQQAGTGWAACMIVLGPPGVGKSELLRHLRGVAEAGRAAGSAWQVVAVRAAQFDAGMPLATLTEMIRALRTYVGRTAPEHRAVLESLLGGARAAAPTVQSLGIALLALLSSATDGGNLLLIVDDVHWLDAASVGVLAFAAHRLRAEPVALVCAGREAPALLAGAGTVLTMSGLNEADAALLVRRASAHPVVPEVAHQLGRLAEGNPLALEEAVHQLSADHLAGTRPLPDPLPIGPGGRALVGPVVAGLPARTRRALLVVTLAGGASHVLVPPALRLLGLDVADLDDAVSARIVVAGDWTLRHPLFGWAVHDGADPADLRLAHRALARVTRRTDVARHAHHLAASAGGIDEHAAAELAQAARSEAARGGAAAAAKLWDQAAALSPPGSARVARQLTAAETLTIAGQRDAAARRLAELATAPLSQAEFVRVTRARAELLVWGSNVGEDIVALTTVADDVAKIDVAAAADIHLLLSIAAFSIGARDLVLHHARRAVDLTREDRVRAPVAGLTLGVSRAVFEGATWEPDITSLDDDATRRYLVGQAPVLCAGLAQSMVWLERRDESRALRSLLIDGARRAGAAAVLPYPLASGGELEWWTGRWEDGKRSLDEALALGAATGQDTLLVFTVALRALYAAAQGDRRELASGVQRCADHVASFGFTPALIYSLRAQLHDALARQQLPQAIALGAEAAKCADLVGLASVIQVPYLPEYAEAAVRAGHPSAAALIDELDQRAQESAGPWVASAGARVHGLFAPSPSEAEDQFRRALDAVPLGYMPFEHARTLLCFGGRLARDGNLDDARARLTDALGVFDTLGAVPWRQATAAALRAIGARPRRGAVPAAPLSRQQRQVCELVAHGASNREAAAALFVSEKTIEYHLRRAAQALGAASRADLARRYTEQLASSVPAW